MFANNRFWRKSRLLIFLVLGALFLSACTGVLDNGNWPGLSADGDIVYVARGQDVRAVNVAEQRELWAFPEEGNSQLNFFAPPEVADGAIYLGDYGAAGGFFSPSVTVSIYALDKSGAGIPNATWVKGDIAADRVIGQPFLSGERLYVTTADNFLFALDAATGELQWEFLAGHSIWAQPIVVEDVLYLSSMDRSLYGLSAENGSIIWQLELDGALPSAPLFHEGILYLGGFAGKLYAVEARTGELLWEYAAADWIWSTPSIVDDTLVFADGSGAIFAITLEGETVWQREAAGPVQAPTLVHDDIIYVASVGQEEDEMGQVMAINLDGSIIWQKTAEAPVFANMVVAGDSLVVAVNGEDALLVLYDLQSGAEGWNYSPDN